MAKTRERKIRELEDAKKERKQVKKILIEAENISTIRLLKESWSKLDQKIKRLEQQLGEEQ